MDAAAPRSATGAQTLARGLTALGAVAAAPQGLTVQDVADLLGVHRTIAYRLIATLVEAGYAAKGEDGRYRGATGLLALRAAGYESLTHATAPLLAELADSLGATTALLVAENDEAVALQVLSPRASRYHIAFSTGSRHPLDRGAAGHALMAAMPPRENEAHEVTEARDRGWTITYGQVETGAWGLAAPVRLPSLGIVACVNVITHRDVVRDSVERVVACARQIQRVAG